jgi:hypothetical protein
MTPEQRESSIRSLVSAARAVLSLQVGLAVGTNRILGALSRLGPDFNGAHPIFGEFIHSIPPEVPIGGARLLWNPETMLKTDELLANAEQKYRRAVLRECVEIIRKYG